MINISNRKQAQRIKKSPLTGSIEQSQRVWLSADHDRDGIVVEDGRHVLRGKFVGRVGDEQAGLTDGTVAHHDALYRLHFFFWSHCCC